MIKYVALCLFGFGIAHVSSDITNHPHWIIKILDQLMLVSGALILAARKEAKNG